MEITQEDRQILRINAPEWFALDAFRTAVQRGTAPESDYRMATFHLHGMSMTGSSDIFILFDAWEDVGSDGTLQWNVQATDLLDQPGLEEVHKSLVEITRKLRIHSGLLWLTNVEQNLSRD